MSGPAIEILLVEDNPGDVRLTLEGLKDSKITNRVSVVNDGIEALAFLRKEKSHAQAPTPDLILLDLNLPRLNGFEVLTRIKADKAFRHIPVITLTSSKAEEDIPKSYNLHGNCFITKPIDFSQFMKVIRSIENFWLMIVELPPKP